MIRSENGTLSLEGTLEDLFVDLSMIIEGIAGTLAKVDDLSFAQIEELMHRTVDLGLTEKCLKMIDDPKPH